MENDDELLTLAKIGRVHGLKGWLRIHSYTEPQSNLANYRTFQIAADPARANLEMDQLKQQGNNLIAHFQGYDQPEQAQELVGIELQVVPAQLPKLDSGEFYWHQLKGLSVINQQGQNLGKVARLMETGANDVLVVSATDDSVDRHERLIPFLQGSVVKKIDPQQELIEVDWGVDYLL
ncbi:MAG: ribosome maturation factor RimM [Gammaproteobacteria bacterium]|nr:ribosome maturation factor RimM [Gammaproteobacteria bacterium]